MPTKLPQVMGLVFCEEFDPLTFSMRGLFQGRYFSTFPTGPQEFTVYSAVYSGGLEGTMELSCEQMETEKTIFAIQTWRILIPGMVMQYPIRVKRIHFPAPGRYVFRLRFDGAELATRFLEVIREGD